MRVLLAVCLSLLAIPSYSDARLHTFTSPAGVFQFDYPSVLVHCRQKQAQEGWWVPQDNCNSHDGICDDQGSLAVTIACFAYPKDEFKDKPEFSAAAFFVAEVRTAGAEAGCLRGSQNWLIERTEDAIIHSVRMKRFMTSDARLGGGQTGESYRVFRGRTCNEFGIQWESTNPAAFDPARLSDSRSKTRPRFPPPCNGPLIPSSF